MISFWGYPLGFRVSSGELWPDTRWFVSGKGLSCPDRHLVLHIQQHSVLDRDLCHDVETRDATWNDGRCARRDQEQFRSVNRDDTERLLAFQLVGTTRGMEGLTLSPPTIWVVDVKFGSRRMIS